MVFASFFSEGCHVIQEPLSVAAGSFRNRCSHSRCSVFLSDVFGVREAHAVLQRRAVRSWMNAQGAVVAATAAMNAHREP